MTAPLRDYLGRILPTVGTDVATDVELAQQVANLGTFLGASNGADDTTRLNTALAGGGSITGTPGQTYRISAPLVVRSGTVLNMTGCTVQAVGAFSSHMLTNYAVMNPTYNNEDSSATAGSNVLTLTDKAAAANYRVGQTVVQDGAGGIGGPTFAPGAIVPLVGTVTAVNPTAGTVTIDQTAKTSTPAWGLEAFDRDHDIKIIGGRWDRGSFGFTGLAIKGNSLHFRHVDNLVCEIDEFNSVTNVAHYPISVADVTNVVLGIGNCISGRDGIHLMGPARDVHVSRLHGVCSDDLFSITASDYAGGLTDSAGDVVGVSWGRISGRSTQSLVKILAGANKRIAGVRGGLTEGTASSHVVWIGEDTGNLGTVGGTYEDIDVGTVIGVSLTPASRAVIFLASPNAQTVRGRINAATFTGPLIATGRGGTGGATSGAASAATVERLDVAFDGPVSGPMLQAFAGAATMIRQFLTDRGTVFGIPMTVDATTVRGNDVMVVGPTLTHYIRVREGGVISKIAFGIGTSAGNVSVAVYRNTGVGRAARPGPRLAGSASVPCPAAGYGEVALGATVDVRPGDWLAFSTDSATATFAVSLSGTAPTFGDLAMGVRYVETVHPAPASPGTLATRLGNPLILVGT